MVIHEACAAHLTLLNPLPPRTKPLQMWLIRNETQASRNVVTDESTVKSCQDSTEATRALGLNLIKIKTDESLIFHWYV